MKKRLLSMLLIICMIISLTPSVIAADADVSATVTDIKNEVVDGITSAVGATFSNLQGTGYDDYEVYYEITFDRVVYIPANNTDTFGYSVTTKSGLETAPIEGYADEGHNKNGTTYYLSQDRNVLYNSDPVCVSSGYTFAEAKEAGSLTCAVFDKSVRTSFSTAPDGIPEGTRAAIRLVLKKTDAADIVVAHYTQMVGEAPAITITDETIDGFELAKTYALTPVAGYWEFLHDLGSKDEAIIDGVLGSGTYDSVNTSNWASSGLYPSEEAYRGMQYMKNVDDPEILFPIMGEDRINVLMSDLTALQAYMQSSYMMYWNIDFILNCTGISEETQIVLYAGVNGNIDDYSDNVMTLTMTPGNTVHLLADDSVFDKGIQYGADNDTSLNTGYASGLQNLSELAQAMCGVTLAVTDLPDGASLAIQMVLRPTDPDRYDNWGAANARNGGFTTGGLGGTGVTWSCDLDYLARYGNTNYKQTIENNIARGFLDISYESIYPNGTGPYDYLNLYTDENGRYLVYLTEGESNDDAGVDEEVETKIELSEEITVPAALLTNPDLDTAEEIKAALESGIAYFEGFSASNTKTFDATLMYSDDGGVTWQKADEEHFPSDGRLLVKIGYPDGTNNEDYCFKVAHMFTSAAFGKTPGAIEYPDVSKLEDGIEFYVTGLSPITIGWKSISGSVEQELPNYESHVLTEAELFEFFDGSDYEATYIALTNKENDVFGMNFKATETYEEASTKSYADYNADFVLTSDTDINVLLLGNYGNWGTIGFVAELKAGVPYRVIKDSGIGELYGKQPYKGVVEYVGDFDCVAIPLTDQVKAAYKESTGKTDLDSYASATNKATLTLTLNLYETEAYEDTTRETEKYWVLGTINQFDYDVYYTVIYTDGVEGKEIFENQSYTVTAGSATPAFVGTPVRSGYIFTGWTPAVSETVTADVTYTAAWTYDYPDIVIPTTYSVTVKDSVGGDVDANRSYATVGTTVKLTVTPDEGYELDTLTVKAGSREISTTYQNGTYNFTMPYADVTVEATFKKIEAPVVSDECPGDWTCPMYPYSDLNTALWYHDGIHFCIEHGLMGSTSTSELTFEPNLTTTRAMIVTILWRLEGSPAVNYAMDFEDVETGKWYTEAIRWAASEKIVEGYGNGKFGTNDAITREQMATILYRYEQSKGGGFTGMWMYHMDFADLADVSEWAYEAMCWMNMNEVITGKPGNVLDPSGGATRAEAAAMLQRYCEIAADD